MTETERLLRRFSGLWAVVTALTVSQDLKAWNLTLLSRYDSPNFELLDIEISGDYAFVPAGLGGLNVIDISDPTAPFTVARYSAYGCDYGRLYAWHINGNHAYGRGRDCGIRSLDVSNPVEPVSVGDYGSPEFSYEQTDGFAYGDGGRYLYAAIHADGVEVIDISAPESPQPVTRVPTENAWAVEVSEDGNLVYAADGAGGLKVIDVSSPEVARVIGEASASGTAKDVTVSGNYLFVAVGARGVDMFDVSLPETPVLVANYNTTGYASRVAVSDSLVAVSDWDDVEVLKWDDSPSLRLAGYKNTGGRVMAIHMQGDVVYSAEWNFFRTFRFGEISGPDIDASSRNMNFPHLVNGTCLDTTVTILNNGSAELNFENIAIDHSDYSASVSADHLAPGGSAGVTITYCGSSANGFANLKIRSDDPDEPQIAVTLEGNSTWGLDVGQSAPDFTLTSVNGYGDVTLSKLRAKAVIVAFFATW
ncbi:MAG: hypothetical protein ACE5LH_09795 [Fidelibacterota bacterium]